MNPLLLAQAAALSLSPRHWLETAVQRQLAAPPYIFHARFSGRVALRQAALFWRERSEKSVALVPDYVCNIVHRAIESAGWKVEAYETDRLLEPDWSHLCRRIEVGDIGLLVGASVFGSSGLIDFLDVPEHQQMLRNQSTQVIVDLAQDIGLVKLVPPAIADRTMIVVSFNNKSFPGIMGGGLLCREDTALSPEPKRSASLAIIRRAARSAMKALLRRDTPRPFAYEYSQCRTFPFRLDEPFSASRLQLAIALLGIWKRSVYLGRKQRLLSEHRQLPTRFAASAAYLVVDAARGDERTKVPYAMEFNPQMSLRPNDVIVHNKGFDDHG